MTLLSYEIFQTVIEQGSFARAAGVLHLTPSAISHSISAMEEEVGCALFVRGKNGVNLTGAGQQGHRWGRHRCRRSVRDSRFYIERK